MDENELVGFASHEAELIWSRYNAMVVADTIFIAAIAAIAKDKSWAFGGACAGILLTAIWWLLTSAGWSLSHAMIYAIDGQPQGPIRVYQQWRNRVWRYYADPIWWLAHAVIGLFYVVYATMAVYFAGKLFASVCAMITTASAAVLLLLGIISATFRRFSVDQQGRSKQPTQPTGSARG